jgi:uncharacterized protein YukE
MAGKARPALIGFAEAALVGRQQRSPGRLTTLSVLADTVAPMSDSATWATSAANKFREVQRTTENQTTKLLAEGLIDLAEAIRDLDAK